MSAQQSQPRSAGAARLDALIARIHRQAAHTQRLVDTVRTASESDDALLPPTPPPETFPPERPSRMPFTLTYVAYDGSLLGYAAALATLMPIFLIVALTTWILARRELRAMWLMIGALLTTALNGALKHSLRQPRPEAATLEDFGMPSNHAQLTAYFVAYTLLFLWRDVTMVHPSVWKPLLTAGALTLLVAVGASRIYLHEHSPAQVGVGAIIGCAAGALWHWLYLLFALPVLRPRLADSSIGRYFYVRETSTVPDVMRTEYEALSSEAAQRLAWSMQRHGPDLTSLKTR
jgi:dolichyldiphosphatase